MSLPARGPAIRRNVRKNARSSARFRTLSLFAWLRIARSAISPAWVIEAQPKAGYRAVHAQAKDLAKVRATSGSSRTLPLGESGGRCAEHDLGRISGCLRIARGSTLHFEQTQVNDEIWLPSSIVVHFEARLALVKELRGGV